MKFQIPQNSLFATLTRSPWWISVAIAAALIVLAATLLPAQFRLIGSMASVPFFVTAVISARRHWRLPSREQAERARQVLAGMGWPEFSALLADAYRREGNTFRHGAMPGVDFDLEKGSRRTLVCARRWKSAHASLDALRVLQTARETVGATDAIYICLGELTTEARPFAARHNISICQSAELARLLRGRF